MSGLQTTLQFLFYAFDVAFKFWFLLILMPLRGRGHLLRNMLYMWSIWAVIRVFLLFNPSPIESGPVPEPFNTVLFGAVGFLLLALYVVIERVRK